jgi:phosphoribosyl 1,2-cyclic phosphate phosphodiesterase
MGVPTLGCHCPVCVSTNPRDQRTRPSVLVEFDGRAVVIDTTPDFRTQAMSVRLDRLDAVLFTHGHADHIMGLDDIRPYNMKQGGAVPIYASADTLKTLKRTFAYIFEEGDTPSSLPGVDLHEINGKFSIFGAEVIPIPARHGPNAVLGYRIGDAAYLTDFSDVPESSKKLLMSLDHFILDALRYTPHPMHSNVAHSLALVDELKPRHAWFTHICHDLAHEETNARLPQNVRLSYDGLVLETQL